MRMTRMTLLFLAALPLAACGGKSQPPRLDGQVADGLVLPRETGACSIYKIPFSSTYVNLLPYPNTAAAFSLGELQLLAQKTSDPGAVLVPATGVSWKITCQHQLSLEVKGEVKKSSSTNWAHLTVKVFIKGFSTPVSTTVSELTGTWTKVVVPFAAAHIPGEIERIEFIYATNHVNSVTVAVQNMQLE